MALTTRKRQENNRAVQALEGIDACVKRALGSPDISVLSADELDYLSLVRTGLSSFIADRRKEV